MLVKFNEKRYNYVRRSTMISWLIVFCFIIFDVISGVLKALTIGNVSSKCLRIGLIHKFTELLTLFGTQLLELGIAYLDITIIPPLFKPFTGYICLMELVSIIENLSEINPILKGFFSPYLEKIKEGEDKNGIKRD